MSNYPRSLCKPAIRYRRLFRFFLTKMMFHAWWLARIANLPGDEELPDAL